MEPCSDIYQPFRMAFVWPVIVGLMAAVVSTTISRNWTGSDAYWLAFTIGLAFAVGVLLANVIMSILEAGRDG